MANSTRGNIMGIIERKVRTFGPVILDAVIAAVVIAMFAGMSHFLLGGKSDINANLRAAEMHTGGGASTGPGAKADKLSKRVASHTRFANQNGKKALGTAMKYQGQIVESPAWSPPKLRRGERIKRYLSPTLASLDVPGQDADAMVSSMGSPFAVERNGRLNPIKLDLEPTLAGWSPANAAQNSRFPIDLSKPLTIGNPGSGDGSMVSLGEASEDGVVVGGKKVFYANVGTDTDVIAEPLPAGIEVSWILRSPRSPESLRFDASIPEGASLKSTEEGSLNVVSHGSVVATISAPNAFDAERRPVSARLHVGDGGAVTVLVDHRDDDIAYPVAVDPLFNWYGALVVRGANPGDGLPETVTGTWGYWLGTPSISASVENLYDGWFRYKLQTNIGATAAGNATWSYDAPGDSSVFRTEFGAVGHTLGSPGGTFQLGVWDPVTGYGNTAWAGWQNGSTCLEVTPGNIPGCQANGVFGNSSNMPLATVVACAVAGCAVGGQPNGFAMVNLIKSSGSTVTSPDIGEMRGGYVYFTDFAAPSRTLTGVNLDESWQSVPSLSIHAEVADSGVGLGNRFDSYGPGKPGSAFEVIADGAAPDPGNAFGPHCYGDRWDPCPNSFSADGDLKLGVHTYEFNSYDIVGHSKLRTNKLKIDNDPPEITLGGRLGVFAREGLGAGEAARTISGDTPFSLSVIDGTTDSNQNRRSGADSAHVWVTGSNYDAQGADTGDSGVTVPGVGELGAFTEATSCHAEGDSCKIVESLVFPGASLSPGVYYIHVNAVDQIGKSATKTYKIVVGSGTIDTISEGLATSKYVPLQATPTNNSAQAVVFQWRAGLGDPAWKQIHECALRYELHPENWVTMGLVGVQPDGSTDRVVVNLDEMSEGGCGGTRIPDGPIVFRALFLSQSGQQIPQEGSSSEDVLMFVDRGGRMTQNHQTDLGPGTVDLSTGNLTINTVDTKVDAYRTPLEVSRTFATRYAQTPPSGLFGIESGPLGVGWDISLPTDGSGTFEYVYDWADSSIPEEDRFPVVDVDMVDGSMISFELDNNPSPTADETYIAEEGFEHLKLRRVRQSGNNVATEKFLLVDSSSGETTTFAKADPEEPGGWIVTSVDYPASTEDVTYQYADQDPGAGSVLWPTRVVAPVSNAAGIDCGSTFGQENRGCQALGMVYENLSIQGNSVRRLTAIKLSAWDPAAGAMVQIEIARYEYDTNGRLWKTWDPRVSPALKTIYQYDAAGLVSRVTPPGQEGSSEEPVDVAYAMLPGESGAGRVESVSRSALADGTATSRIRYDVPVSGGNAPYPMGDSDVLAWSQKVPPFAGTAVFPPDQQPNGSNYGYAELSYLDSLGREVNHASAGGGISTVEYNKFGEEVRELSPTNREKSLESPTPSVASELLDTQRTYGFSDRDSTVRHPLTVIGPQHKIRRSANGVPASEQFVDARDFTRFNYDEGAPADGIAYGLVTTAKHSARLASDGSEVDTRTRTYKFDWTTRSQYEEILDPEDPSDGDNESDIHKRVVLNEIGQPVERRQPEHHDSAASPDNTKLVYYEAGSAPGGTAHPECFDHPEWIGLTCVVAPAAQPTTSGMPDLPVRRFEYNLYRQPVEVDESVAFGSANSARTSSVTYDAAGRPVSEEIEGTTDHEGTTLEPLSKVVHVYDARTGRETETKTVDAGGATIKSIKRAFDNLGRQTSYTDANDNVSTTTFDLLSRPVVTNDGKGSQTRSYDPVTGDLSTLSDSQIGVMNATYDAEGRVVAETLPNALVKAYTYDQTGGDAGVTYFKSTGCSENCIWYENTVERTTHGQVANDQDTFSSRSYEYDPAGRLTQSQSTRNGRCTTRSYGYDQNSNRSSQGSNTSPDINCDPGSGAATNRAYDDADRLIDSGYVYDSFGRITNVPQADAGSGGDLSATYYTNDLARSIKQGTTTQTLSLDPAMRAFQKSKDEDGVVTAEKYAFDGDSDSPSWIGSDTGFSQSLLPVGVGGAAAGATQVATGDNHTCALISGAVKCWGINTYGQLGNGTTTTSDTPVQVTGLESGVDEVSAGTSHTCARLNTGAVKCWGRNSSGQLGDNSLTNRTTPVAVQNIASGATDLGAGGTHTCAVVLGAAKCWGANSAGQLGNNSSATSKIPVQVSGMTTGTKIVDGGNTGTCAVTDAGQAKCWGGGSAGQMGDGTTTYYRRIPVNVVGMQTGTQDIQIATTHACATTTTGTVKCWGNNSAGQLGDGTQTRRTSPVAASNIAAGATSVAVGTTHSCAVVSEALHCWGANTNGRLGDGTTTMRLTPTPVSGLANGVSTIAAGTAHSCASTTANKVRCWGNNSSGQVGPRPSSTYTRYVTAIGGGLAASYKSTGQIRYQIANVRGDVVAEADQNGLQQVAAVDEFGVPEDGALPEGRRYGFMGSHQREALTPGGTVAMGVRLYVPTAGRFAQVDPVLGGSDGPYDYVRQDPLNSIDLDGKQPKSGSCTYGVMRPVIVKNKADKPYVNGLGNFDCLGDGGVTFVFEIFLQYKNDGGEWVTIPKSVRIRRFKLNPKRGGWGILQTNVRCRKKWGQREYRTVAIGNLVTAPGGVPSAGSYAYSPTTKLQCFK